MGAHSLSSTPTVFFSFLVDLFDVRLADMFMRFLAVIPFTGVWEQGLGWGKGGRGFSLIALLTTVVPSLRRSYFLVVFPSYAEERGLVLIVVCFLGCFLFS